MTVESNTDSTGPTYTAVCTCGWKSSIRSTDVPVITLLFQTHVITALVRTALARQA